MGTNGRAEKEDNKSGVLLGNFTANYKKAFGKHYITYWDWLIYKITAIPALKLQQNSLEQTSLDMTIWGRSRSEVW